MQFAQFERAARAAWHDIPEEYKAGIDGLIVEQASLTEDEDEGIFTLGECATREYPSQYGGPDTIRSAVVLYYGSFVAVADGDDEFDWDGEIRETIMHELKHHLESLADEDALVDYDYAVDHNFRRRAGAEFDAGFYLNGEAIAEGMFLVEEDVFLHFATPRRGPLSIEFNWEDDRYRVVLPAGDKDVTFVRIDGGPDLGDGDFYVVRVLRRSTLDTLRHVFAPDPADRTAGAAVAQAERVT